MKTTAAKKLFHHPRSEDAAMTAALDGMIGDDDEVQLRIVAQMSHGRVVLPPPGDRMMWPVAHDLSASQIVGATS